MDGWVMRAGEQLLPLAEVIQRELLVAPYLQADETPVALQLYDGNGYHSQPYSVLDQQAVLA
jgi:transposase